MNSLHVFGLLRVACVAAFSAVAAHAAAQTRSPLELTADDVGNAIDPAMATWIGKHKGPGAVVVVVNRDGAVFAAGYGFSDIADKKPFTADTTLVRPGSISKLFTAIAVMQLVAVGKLDLDRDVNGYIDFAIPTPEGGVPVTLRRLLTHRAGFEEHVRGLFSREREPEPLGRWLANNLPRRLFPKGDVEAYSNYGVALAGYIVERVSGEPYVAYMQRHILDPLGMTHSTFQQPLPDELAPLMARGYRRSDMPPQAYFETISAAPAGALSATGADIGRFMRAFLNGGELDGVRILSRARLDEMMTPEHPTPAGYIGLAFFGAKIAGHDSVGHDGATLTFFSNLRFFPERGVGIFVSRVGIGDVTQARDVPDPAVLIARRLVPKVPDAAGAVMSAGIAGIYQTSRRSEATFVSLSALMAQRVVKVDGAGHARGFFAIWPFGDGVPIRHMGQNLYEGALGRFAFVDDAGSGSYIAVPGFFLQRVPLSLDLRWIAPALIASTSIAVLTLLAWPIGALWRRWRKRRFREDGGDQRKYLATRLVALIDMAVIVAAAVLFVISSDLTIFNAALDPLILAFYAFAWLGVVGAVFTLWVAAQLWRNRVGSRWSRIHHTLMAAGSVMLAWFFLTFHLAGTTLNY